MQAMQRGKNLAERGLNTNVQQQLIEILTDINLGAAAADDSLYSLHVRWCYLSSVPPASPNAIDKQLTVDEVVAGSWSEKGGRHQVLQVLDFLGRSSVGISTLNVEQIQRKKLLFFHRLLMPSFRMLADNDAIAVIALLFNAILQTALLKKASLYISATVSLSTR